MIFKLRNLFYIVLLIAVFLLISGCRANPPAITPNVSGPSAAGATLPAASLPAATPQAPTAAPSPTITLEPPALQVNGEGVSVAEYQAELSQLQEALKTLG